MRSFRLLYICVCVLGVAGVLHGLGAARPSSASSPSVQFFGIYRGYPDEAIQISILASDPDGTAVRFTSADLPSGASLDELSGLFEWMPTVDQVGSYEVTIDVTDQDQEQTSRLMLFQVAPLDSCNVSDCDPERGCVPTLPPVPDVGGSSTACCVDEPVERISEPSSPLVGCPLSEVLYLGRNKVGFGRIQNCDELQVFPFAQGGTNIRFHVEARCVSDEVAIEVEINRVDGGENPTLVSQSARCLQSGDPECTHLTTQPDGFQRALQLSYFTFENGFDLDGLEVDMRVKLTDLNGVVLERRHRLTLTLSDLADLPNPDAGDDPADEAGCVGCHRPLDETGQRVGIEDAHPGFPLGCTACHGGNGNAFTRLESHVQPGPDDPSFIRDLASDQLDALSSDYLRFINPGDLRVAEESCGASGCHPQHVARVRLSTMATYGGHYTLPRYLAGSQDRNAVVAAVDVVDPDFDPATAPEGAIAQLSALREPHPLADRSELGSVVDAYLPKSCPTCHLNAFGKNDSPGSYRSSGCTACHMVYADDGLSASADPTEPVDLVRHPIVHQLTTRIPTQQCGHCHFQGGRIGLAFRGIREGGFAPEKTPENGVTLGRSLYGHDPDYYFSDEDDTNAVDETPPDLHYAAGMACMDCHVGGDVHGDGSLYSSERYQVGIRCEDCHGTVRDTIEPDPDTGLFLNSKGFPLERLIRLPQGVVLLELANAPGVYRVVRQIKEVLDAGTNPAMTEAMGVDPSGFSHTDSLECYACHTSWRQTCFGCHVTQNDSFSQKNETTGLVSQGAFVAERDDYSLDFFALGENGRGKISPLCNSMSLLLGYTDENGQPLYTDAIRQTHDGRRGFGWNPFHHHTVSRTAQGCERCHPAAGGGNETTLAETYGFGNGSVTVMDGVEEVDLTGFLDASGNLVSDFPHPGTGPVPADVRARAMAVVIPEPAGSELVLAAVASLVGIRRWRRCPSRTGSRAG